MSGYHDAHLTHDPQRSLVWRVVARHLASTIMPTDRVLELGAGYCDWINNVTASRRVALDSWPGVVRFAAAGVEAHILDAALARETLGDDTFDVALASNLLEHFAPDAAERLVRDVFRMLGPGGRFVLIQPNFRIAWRRYFDDYTHRAIFTDVSLPSLLRSCGFEIERVQPRFLPYSMRQAAVPVRSWMVQAYLHSPIKPFAGQMLVVARKD